MYDFAVFWSFIKKIDNNLCLFFIPLFFMSIQIVENNPK